MLKVIKKFKNESKTNMTSFLEDRITMNIGRKKNHKYRTTSHPLHFLTSFPSPWGSLTLPWTHPKWPLFSRCLANARRGKVGDDGVVVKRGGGEWRFKPIVHDFSRTAQIDFRPNIILETRPKVLWAERIFSCNLSPLEAHEPNPQLSIHSTRACIEQVIE